MGNYSFRLRFFRSPYETVGNATSRIVLPGRKGDPEVILVLAKKGQEIGESKTWILFSSGWPSTEEAKSAGIFYSRVLERALAQLRIGADYGSRAAKSAFTKVGLEKMGKAAGGNIVKLNDVHGLMIYENAENVSLVLAQSGFQWGPSKERLIKVFKHALIHPRKLTAQEKVCLELFNASFFQGSPDARLLLLMGGLEALMEPEKKSTAISNHIDGFLSLTNESKKLTQDEKSQLKGALRQLKNESFRQAGRKFVAQQLSSKIYMQLSPERFFNYCYTLRNKLIHGSTPLPTFNETSAVAGPLQTMVSDLLSIDLLELEP